MTVKFLMCMYVANWHTTATEICASEHSEHHCLS